MKIGILTYFAAHNYGAFLQAYALREFVARQMKAEVELINFRTEREVRVYCKPEFPSLRPRHFWQRLREFSYNKLQYEIFEESIRKYQMLSREQLISDSIEEFVGFIRGRYDLIIVGSDEVWKVDGFRSFPNAYWLPGVSCQKMAYAVSSRNLAINLTEQQKALIKEYIESFSYIGLRDRATYHMITKFSNNPEKCFVNCDPTFLYDFPTSRENGKRILKEKFRVQSIKKVVGLISADGVYGQKIAQMLSKEYEVVSLSSYIDGAKNYGGLTPFDWIDAIAACDAIITSRFHGMVFAIKSSRPFLIIEMENYSKITSKTYDLLERNNLAQRYVEKGEEVEKVLFQHIPKFLQQARQRNYYVDYSKMIVSEKQRSESFVDRLRLRILISKSKI